MEKEETASKDIFLSKLEYSLDAIQKSIATAYTITDKQGKLQKEIISIRVVLDICQDNLISNELLSKMKECIETLSHSIQNEDANPFHAFACEIISSFLLMERYKEKYKCKIANGVLATKMALRATSLWLAIKDSSNAYKCLDLSNRCIKTMKEIVNVSNSFATHRTNVEKFEIISNLYRLELLSDAEEQHSQAFLLLSEVKNKTYEFRNLQNYLGNICYNNGIKCFRSGNYEWSVTWLRHCYDLIKECFKSQKQTIVLRMLAEAYVKWDANQYWRKALHAINLAYVGRKSADYFVDSLYIILRGEDPVGLDDFIKQIEKFTDNTSLIFSTKVVEMLLNFGHNAQALIVSRVLRKKKISLPQLSHLMILELKICLDDGNYTEGRAVAEEYINNLEEQTQIIDHRTCLLCLGIASKYFKGENFLDALTWYQYCIRLHRLMGNGDKDLKHTHWLKRQACFCHVGTSNLQEAKLMLDELISVEPKNDLNELLELKIGFLMEDGQLVESSLNYFVERFPKRMSSDTPSCRIGPSHVMKAIVDCVHVAAEKNRIEFSITVLEKLLLTDEGLVNNHTTKIKMLRCLLRLQLTNTGNEPVAYDKCLECVSKCEECLDSVQQNQQISQECLWFAKVCWNTSTQGDVPVSIMHQLFVMGWKFLRKIKRPDVTVATQKTNCLLMAASSGLVIARQTENETLKESTIRAVLGLINESENNKEITNSHRTLLQAMLLYEFEARTMINCPTLPVRFQEVANLSELDAKFFELLATVSMEHGMSHYPLTANSLKIAIKKYSEKPIDFVQLSRNYHSLIQITLEALTNNERDTYQEALTYINQLLEFMHQEGGGCYPEIELVWTMVKCWNCGILYLLRQDDRSAFEWCSTSMKFLKYLGSFETVYRDKMTELFEGLFGDQSSY